MILSILSERLMKGFPHHFLTSFSITPKWQIQDQGEYGEAAEMVMTEPRKFMLVSDHT